MERKRLFPAFLAVATAGMFVVTTFASGAYRTRRQQLAREWYTRGEAELSAGRSETAIRNLRTALAYSRDDPRYSLRLAEALVSAGRTDEARSHLFYLAQTQPGDAMVNLELARLEASGGDVSEAIRYYRNAVYGVWDQRSEYHRVEVRMELARFLMQHNDLSGARNELVSAAADVPRDPALYASVGKLLLDVGDFEQALETFRAALNLDPRSAEAVKGAGQAAYLAADYENAARYLRRAVTLNRDDQQAEQLMATCESVLAHNPYLRGLTAAERAERAAADLNRALQRLRQCAEHRGVDISASAPDSRLQRLNTAAKALHATVSRLTRDPEQLDRAMEVVFDIEAEVVRSCGPGEPADAAMLRIAHDRGRQP